MGKSPSNTAIVGCPMEGKKEISLLGSVNKEERKDQQRPGSGWVQFNSFFIASRNDASGTV